MTACKVRKHKNGRGFSVKYNHAGHKRLAKCHILPSGGIACTSSTATAAKSKSKCGPKGCKTKKSGGVKRNSKGQFVKR